ncbi:TonB C-terminal domain-containing protein [Tsuneonella amylolytica]|uniref:TonB C-terminal domain-containing protein n=1 Tax=Tsuneonella amylolytica TaxID=2338327 RepID=UPI000EAA451B|nr:TonB C-terminal domain-containing protein [Tsuneonella amylolytica]
MVFADLRTEEKLGLGIALALHVALAAALLVQPETRAVVPPVEKMTVNLTTDVGLTATAPDPVPTSAAASAPVFSPEPAAPEPVAAPEPAPAPEPFVQPRPEPPRAKPVERAVAKPQPAPVRKPATKPQPKPVERTAAAPQPKAQPKPATQPRRVASTATRQPSTSKPAGASRVGSDFLAGAGDSTTTRETRTPASQIGASAKASLFQQIAKELRPKWQPPSGPEVEKLVTKVRFRLNADGSLIGRPEVVRQTGETDTNKPQASRHAEQAIRAVQLAAPFDLPEEYYEAFKVVTVDFDWKLAQ